MKMENKNTNNNGALKYNTKIIIIQVRVGVGHVWLERRGAWDFLLSCGNA